MIAQQIDGDKNLTAMLACTEVSTETFMWQFAGAYSLCDLACERYRTFVLQHTRAHILQCSDKSRALQFARGHHVARLPAVFSEHRITTGIDKRARTDL
jgi:hypothetical protein